MNLYLVARWGNDEEGPDGKDTIYLVAAKSHLIAASAAEEKLKQLPHNKVPIKANWICLLGVVDLNAHYKGILKGPYYDLSGILGAKLVWVREYGAKRWRINK